MTLTQCSELSAADWLTGTDQPWNQLVSFGPAGFPAYARLRFLPDPADEGQSENDVYGNDDAATERMKLCAALEVLARHTNTPTDCYFCLWDGWIQQDHPGDLTPRHDPQPGLRSAVPALDPSSSPPTLEPMLVVPHRAYFLYRGSVADLSDQGTNELWPGQPGANQADPAFIWPADQAWCLANDVDPHWAGIGADRRVIDELLTDPRLDVVRADPWVAQPRYR